MKILCFAEWVNERVQIKPVTNAELNKAQQSINDDIAKQQELFVRNFNYKIAKLSSEDAICNKYSRKYGSKFDLKEFSKTANNIWFGKFTDWNNLSITEALKKHEKFVKKQDTPMKMIASMYSAFMVYGHKSNFPNDINDTIVDMYIHMLIDKLGMTEYDIINIFFE